MTFEAVEGEDLFSAPAFLDRFPAGDTTFFLIEEHAPPEDRPSAVLARSRKEALASPVQTDCSKQLKPQPSQAQQTDWSDYYKQFEPKQPEAVPQPEPQQHGQAAWSDYYKQFEPKQPEQPAPHAKNDVRDICFFLFPALVDLLFFAAREGRAGGWRVGVRGGRVEGPSHGRVRHGRQLVFTCGHKRSCVKARRPNHYLLGGGPVAT